MEEKSKFRKIAIKGVVIIWRDEDLIEGYEKAKTLNHRKRQIREIKEITT